MTWIVLIRSALSRRTSVRFQHPWPGIPAAEGPPWAMRYSTRIWAPGRRRGEDAVIASPGSGHGAYADPSSVETRRSRAATSSANDYIGMVKGPPNRFKTQTQPITWRGLELRWALPGRRRRRPHREHDPADSPGQRIGAE